MKNMRVAINGFGRIGRYTLKMMLKKGGMDIVAINDLTDTKTLAHLFKYDSIHGKFDGEVSYDATSLIINGKVIPVFSQKDPAQLPWASLNVDVVVESTGLFRTHDKASAHITAGAKRVIISSPADSDDVKSVVLGVNEHILDGSETVISNASCTTNNAAPMIKIVEELCDAQSGFITTVHSYTSDQRLHDSPHKDLRRARAAAENIIPTSTGAAKAITKIFPDLDGLIGGAGIRVPVKNGSVTDITLIVKNPKSVEEINAAFKKASENELKGILEYTEDPIVSSDIIGNPHSCIYDAELTTVIGNMVKVVGWYDNEAGYSNRLVDLIQYLSKFN